MDSKIAESIGSRVRIRHPALCMGAWAIGTRHTEEVSETRAVARLSPSCQRPTLLGPPATDTDDAHGHVLSPSFITFFICVPNRHLSLQSPQLCQNRRSSARPIGTQPSSCAYSLRNFKSKTLCRPCIRFLIIPWVCSQLEQISIIIIIAQ